MIPKCSKFKLLAIKKIRHRTTLSYNSVSKLLIHGGDLAYEKVRNEETVCSARRLLQ